MRIERGDAGVDLRVYLDIRQDEATVHIAGDLDCYTADDLREALEQVVGMVSERVELDLSQLNFVDSRGIQILVEARERATQDGYDLRLVGPVTPLVQRILDVTGLEHALRWDQESKS